MTKILSTAAYNILKAKAANFDAVVNALVENSEGVTIEDVTLESIQAAISFDDSSENRTERVTELEATVGTLTTTVNDLSTERDTLKTENAALAALPGAESVIKTPKADANADDSADDMVAFAEKHKGDTLAIALEMKKRGLNKKNF